MSGQDEEGPEAPRRGDHIRSFVLRQGRVSEAQKRFHEQGMPRWGISYQPRRAADTRNRLRHGRDHGHHCRTASAE
jgi:hypothetical protein